LLVDDQFREVLSRCIDQANHACGVRLVAFVYMPEHVHLLTYPLAANPNIGRYLAGIKQPASTRIKRLLEARKSPLLDELTVRERPGKDAFRFWQAGPGFDRNLWSPSAIRCALDYIHANPIKRGLSADAIAWKWSSARYYFAEPPRQQDPVLPFIHGPPPGWSE
jgi:putative transposase